jgi:hypothetical protein
MLGVTHQLKKATTFVAVLSYVFDPLDTSGPRVRTVSRRVSGSWQASAICQGIDRIASAHGRRLAAANICLIMLAAAPSRTKEKPGASVAGLLNARQM